MYRIVRSAIAVKFSYFIRCCLLFTALIATLSPAYSAEPNLTFTNAQSAEKLSPGLLQKLRSLTGDTEKFQIIVSLENATSTNSLSFDGAAREKSRQRKINEMQSTVLDAITRAAPRHFEVLYRYNSVAGFSARADSVAIAHLVALGDVAYVEEMQVFEKMDAEAHALTNTTAAHTMGATGAGVTIAIIDDGIQYSHPAFGGHGTFPNSKILGGYDFADFDTNPGNDCDAQSHGTQVAGVAAGNGAGVLGTAPDANIVFLKVQRSANCGNQTLSGDIVASIDWAVTNRLTHNIKIISMSLGGGLWSSAAACDNDNPAYVNVIQAARNAGMAVLAASGNSVDASRISRPACISHATSVGATYDANIGSANFGICNDSTTAAKQVTCYSNSADFLDVLAPSHCATTSTTGGNVSNCFGGTSSATPYAAGIAATLFSANSALSDTDVIDIMKDTGEAVVDSRNNISKPFLQHQSAVEAAIASTTPEFSSPQVGDTLSGAAETFTWNDNGTGASGWWLYLGSSTGGSDYYDSGSLPASTASHTASQLPINGETIYARLWYNNNGWQFIDTTFVAATNSVCSVPTGVTPASGSTLTAGYQTIEWEFTNCEYWVYAGTAAGSKAYDDSGNMGTETYYTINGYPSDGSDVYVTLFYRPESGGSWQNVVLTYTAPSSEGCTAPTSVTPASGSTLSAGYQTIEWEFTNCEYWVYAGIAAGSKAYDDSGNNGTESYYTISGYPSDGSDVYVTLFYRPESGGSWQNVVYTYTAPSSQACSAPTGVTPAGGSTLSAASQTIEWDNTNCEYWVYAGTATGSKAYDDSGSIGNATSYTISGYPSDGSSVYVRLFYRPLTGGGWNSTDVIYTVPGSGFSEQFNGDMSNWQPLSGNWSIVSNQWLYSLTLEEWSSIEYSPNSYSDIDYSAVMWAKPAVEETLNSLTFRSSGSLTIYGECDDCYEAIWTEDGYYSVWKTVGGEYSAIAPWATTSAIVPGWNNVRVVMVGSDIQLFINGTLVWAGSDSTFSSGSVGFQLSDNFDGALWIDSAELTIPAALVATSLSEEQQTANDAAVVGVGGDKHRVPGQQ